MKEERLTILKMVEEGKISADDAVKLMNSLSGAGSKKCDIEDKFNKAGQNFDSFAKDIKSKVETFAKDAEPKMKHTAQSILARTSEVMEELGKGLREFVDNNMSDNNQDGQNNQQDKKDDVVDDVFDNDGRKL